MDTNFLNDSSNIYSPIININDCDLVEQECNYSNLKNARIKLINSLNRIKNKSKEAVREKVKTYEKKLNNKGISSIIKK